MCLSYPATAKPQPHPATTHCYCCCLTPLPLTCPPPATHLPQGRATNSQLNGTLNSTLGGRGGGRDTLHSTYERGGNPPSDGDRSSMYVRKWWTGGRWAGWGPRGTLQQNTINVIKIFIFISLHGNSFFCGVSGAYLIIIFSSGFGSPPPPLSARQDGHHAMQCRVVLLVADPISPICSSAPLT